MVIENFAARPARAGVRHLPEIVTGVSGTFVVTNSNDPLKGNLDFIGPDAVGLIVFLIDRDPELFGRKPIDLGQQFPGKVDGIALEVVTKREVAQHFKKGVMARRVAHVFQVVVLASSSNASLRRRGPLVRLVFAAKENILELHHAAIGKEQGGIVGRNQRARGNNRVTLGLKKAEKFFANLGYVHDEWTE